MKTLLDKLFNHERYQTIAIVITIGLLVFFYGCPSKTQSILFPAEEVTRPELQIELDMLLVKAQQGFAHIEQQEAIKKLLFEQALIAVQTGTINPIAVFTSIAAIIGIGATVDNARKRKEIKSLKNNP